jgi:2-(1,2-epoxy-1,2-dihydrophenyl)acetyl-CoA isomerase
MSMDDVLLEEAEGLATVTFNRPARRNGITEGVVQELHAKLEKVRSGNARVLILRGAGHDFSVGADITAEAVPPQAEIPSYDTLQPLYHSATLLHEMPQVTIAAIDGACAGAGLGWACACDFRFASDRAVFSSAFLRVGASGDMGTAWSLTRVVGGARAREIMLLPAKFGSAEALAHGLVTRVFPHATLHDETLAVAKQLLGYNAFALRMAKMNMVSAEQLSMSEFVEIESARHMHVVNSPSLRQGFADFLKAREKSGQPKA